MIVKEKISGRPGRRLEENWRERLPKKTREGASENREGECERLRDSEKERECE